jgi:hypothetical protein
MSSAPEARLSRRRFLAFGLLLASLQRFLSQTSNNNRSREFLSFDRIEPMVSAGQVPLPADLAKLGRNALRTAWPAWIRNHDRTIRARLVRGQEDTLVNMVLFGVSFTDQPRVSAEIREFDPADRVMTRRIEDFVAALSKPGNNERLLILRQVLTTVGHGIATPDQRERLSDYVSENVARYFSEKEGYDRAVGRSLANDTTSAFSATSELYRSRGLSIDTDFRPNYGIELALAEIKRRGLLASVRRVAVIGPGLDFADKDSGLDHYPLQTLQPFALVDSLLRLGLAGTRTLRVTLFDISAPTLDHVARAVVQAREKRPYTLQMVLDTRRGWNSAVKDYWARVGESIGTSTDPLPLPRQVPELERRAVRIRPEIVSMLEPVDLNAVAQHLVLPGAQRYDLVVATNIFVYYQRFEQALSLLNLEPMLAPGGVLLSNDLFEDFAGVRLRPAASVRAEFSPAQADEIRIYSAPAFSLQLPPQ